MHGPSVFTRNLVNQLTILIFLFETEAERVLRDPISGSEEI